MYAEKIVNWPGRTIQGIEHATVIGVSEEGNYMINSSSGIFVATLAFSCHVRPITGDKIMYTHDPELRCYILAILERQTGYDTILSFPGDVTVESKKGSVAIAAAAGIEMATGSAVNMRASEVSVSAVNGRVNVLDLQATVDSFTGSVNRVHLISDVFDVVAQRVTQRLKSCYRWVEQIEHITAGQMIHKVTNLFSVRARQTAITAKDDVRIDGERVHLG